MTLEIATIYSIGSNPDRAVSEACDDDDFWEWLWLVVKINALS